MEQVMERPEAPRRRSWPRRIARGLMWTVLGVVVLVVVLVTVVLVVNRRDEAPSADARALEAIVASARPVAAGDDALAGLASLQPQRAEAVDVRDAKGQLAAAGARERDRRASRGDRLHDAIGACNARRSDCAALLAAAEPDMPAWIARESGLLVTYRAVLPRRGWYEAPPPASPLDWRLQPVAHALDAQWVLLAQAMVDAREGRGDAVHDALEADARFWRAGLAGARTLFTKMIAARALQRNLDIGLLALARIPADSVAQSVPAAWRAPVSRAERSLLPALAWEWKLSANFMHRTYVDGERRRREHDADAPSLAWVFKPQATSNDSAAMMRRIGRATEMPQAELQGTLRDLGAHAEDQARFPVSLYNPIGRILGAIASPAYLDYVTRVADLEARRRAVLAVLDLHRSATSRERAASALASSMHRNPYTTRPFAWNAAAGCVHIGGLDRIEGHACIPYTPAAGAPAPAAATIR